MLLLLTTCVLTETEVETLANNLQIKKFEIAGVKAHSTK